MRILKKRAVFIDRDGTLNVEVGYLDDLTKLAVYPQAYAAIKRINESGMKAIVVTNQSGVARGFFTENFVSSVHDRIQELLNRQGARIDAFFYCPHHPREGREPYICECACRKPQGGMLLQAAKIMSLDLNSSYMIGDTRWDMEAAGRVGAKGILVRTGYGAETEKEIPAFSFKPVYVADDILSAVDWIIDGKCP